MKLLTDALGQLSLKYPRVKILSKTEIENCDFVKVYNSFLDGFDNFVGFSFSFSRLALVFFIVLFCSFFYFFFLFVCFFPFFASGSRTGVDWRKAVLNLILLKDNLNLRVCLHATSFRTKRNWCLVNFL